MPASSASLYAGNGSLLEEYDLDVTDGSLARRGVTSLPGDLQYGAFHPTLPLLYLLCDVPREPGAAAGEPRAWVLVLRTGPDRVEMVGEPVAVADRPIHLTLDLHGEHLVVAHCRPADLTVLGVNEDGTLRPRIEQREDIDLGVFPHFVALSPTGRAVICVCRGVPQSSGVESRQGPQREPGSISVMGYDDNGRLGPGTRFSVVDEFRFGPRSMDFHPNGTWAYLVLETQSEVLAFTCEGDGLSTSPFQRLSTLADPLTSAHQGLGPIRVHPRGHVLYAANRSYAAGGPESSRIISREGENSVVVYEIGPRDGLLREIQRVPSGGVCPRTLTLDPTGSVLVVANSETYRVGDERGAQLSTKNLTTFRVLPDGRLAQQETHEVQSDSPHAIIGWAGMAHPEGVLSGESQEVHRAS